MFFEMTIQLRVSDFHEGHIWYKTLLKREADYIPHEGFVEWEVITGCWLQVSEGVPAKGSGPLRLAVKDLASERERVRRELDVAYFDIHSRGEVGAKWATFSDPWGNQIGFFEYIDKQEEKERIQFLTSIQSSETINSCG